jgi:NAD(P) transhydrogenase subunit alpha
MYSKNITTFLLHLVKDGQLNLNIEDEIVKGTLVTQGGKLIHPAVIAALEKDQH